MKKTHLFSAWLKTIFILCFVLLSISACAPNIKKLQREGDTNGLIEALTYGCGDEYGESQSYSKNRQYWKNTYIRNDAAKALGGVLHEKHVDTLIKILMNKDLKCAHSNVAELLGEIGDVRAVEPLIDQLAFETYTAASSLAQIGDLRAVEPLITSLSSTDRYFVKVVVNALGDLGDPRAVEALIVTLNDNDIDIRRSAILALRSIGDERAIEALIIRFADKEAQLRELAAISLIELGELSIEPLLDIVSSTPTSSPRDQIIYKTAIETLVEIGDPVIEHLLTRFGFRISDIPYPLSEKVLLHYRQLGEALALVAGGQGVAEAAGYIPGSLNPHAIFFLDNSGAAHPWNEELPSEWIPMTAQDTELVIVVDELIHVVDNRKYGFGWATAYTVTRYWHYTDIYFRDAKNGNLLYLITLEGANLPDFPSKVSKSYDIYTDPVSFSDFWDWWTNYLENNDGLFYKSE